MSINSSQFYKNKSTFIFFILLFVLFVGFILIKSSHGVILFGDINFPLQKQSPIINEFFLWNTNNFGLPLAFPPSLYHIGWKLLTQMLHLYVISNIYYFGQYFLLAISGMYLVKKIYKEATILDMSIVAIFSVTSTLIYPIGVIGGVEEIYSLAIVNIILGFLFGKGNIGNMRFRDFFVLYILLLLGNAYIQTMILFYGIILLYLILFKTKELITYRNKILFMGFLWIGLNLFWIIVSIYNLFGGATFSDIIRYDPKSEGLSIAESISNSQNTFAPFIFDNNLGLIKELYWGGFYIFLIQFFFFILAIFGNFIFKPNELLNKKRLIYFLLGIIVFFYMFSLGTKGRWAPVFMYFWNHMPVFNTYRSIYKFMIPIYYSLIILFIFFLSKLKNNLIKYIILIIIIPSLLVFNREISIARTSTHPIPDFYNRIEKFEKNPFLSYTKIVPDNSWYTVFRWLPNRLDSINILPSYLHGMILYNYADNAFNRFVPKTNDTLNEILLSCYQEPWQIYDAEKILNTLGIQTIIVQKDVIPKNPIGNSSYFCLDRPQHLSYLQLIKKIGDLEIYRNKSTETLPFFYIPSNIYLEKNSTLFLHLVSQTSFKIGSVILFEEQNRPINRSIINSGKDTSFIEYKKINPIKYRVVLHNIKNPLLLASNQNFNQEWKLYVLPGVIQNNQNLVLNNNYQISKYYTSYQANRQDINQMTKQALLSNIEPQKPTKFISKNFHNSVQNENLTDGSIFETFLRHPYKIPENDQYLINAYASGWYLQPEKICRLNNLCRANKNGTYDMELVLEYHPQFIFWIGLVVSSVTLLGSVIYLLVSYGIRKNKKIHSA